MDFFRRIDWGLLVEQKNILGALEFEPTPLSNEELRALSGVLRLLDAVQDHAVRNGIPEETVFPSVLPKFIDGRYVPATTVLREIQSDGSCWVAWGPHKYTKISRYGCGAPGCVECYPFAFGCPYCGATYSIPVPNGEQEHCEECGYTTLED